jgi:hypothetical protein
MTQIAGRTSVGRCRELNEDAFATLLTAGWEPLPRLPHFSEISSGSRMSEMVERICSGRSA